mgnify:CR=1 FL=1
MNRIPNKTINEMINVVLLRISFSCAWSINSFFSALSFSTSSRVANSLLAICSLAIFNFGAEEQKVMDEAFQEAAEAAVMMMTTGAERAMNHYNAKKKAE